jgi:uncharacterized spore protein YtfJ
MLGARKLIARLAGAKVCYGDPVRAGDRVVIPVARVNAVGGLGFGSGRDGKGGGEGGGGGGTFEAAPVGFIDISADGARFEAIPDPMSTARALRTGVSAVGALATALAGIAALRRRNQHRALPVPQKLLRR